MKGFLEEYGVIIVAVIVILAVVTFASTFGDSITEGIDGILSTLFSKSGAVPSTPA